MLGANGTSCQADQERKCKVQKAPKNTPIIHLSGNLVCLAYGLLVDVEDSLRGADLWGVPQSRNPQQWTQGTGRNPKRVCQVVVHVERNKEPMELCHRTDSLKVHRCSGTHSCRKTRMKTKPPHVEQQQWVPESLKRVSSAAEPGADIGVKVNAMFTTDD